MSQNGARSHGPNAVLSMLDNNLDNYFKKRVLAMHADNCVGQTKNMVRHRIHCLVGHC